MHGICYSIHTFVLPLRVTVSREIVLSPSKEAWTIGPNLVQLIELHAAPFVAPWQSTYI